ncbi:MAG: type II toxin-antitoxin system RelE/ParE family toxin [Terricaulis sp.]
MKTLAWDDRALDDLDSIGAYIAADNPHAAIRVIEYIRHAARSLETSPELGKPTSKLGIREFILTRHPYLLAYEVTGDAVRILAIFHHRQNRR